MIKIGLRSGGIATIEGDKVDLSLCKLTDLIWGVAGEQRFSNQLDRPYSVAEHSVHLSNLIPDPLDYDLRLAALGHDLHEAVGFRDVHYQLKTKDQKKVGTRIQKAINKQFILPEWPEDNDLDRLLGNHECLTFHPAKGHYEGEFEMPPFKVAYGFWDKKTAFEKWMETYQTYISARHFLKGDWTLPANLLPGRPFKLEQVKKALPSIPREAVAKKLIELGAKEVAPGSYAV